MTLHRTPPPGDASKLRDLPKPSDPTERQEMAHSTGQKEQAADNPTPSANQESKDEHPLVANHDQNQACVSNAKTTADIPIVGSDLQISMGTSIFVEFDEENGTAIIYVDGEHAVTIGIDDAEKCIEFDEETLTKPDGPCDEEIDVMHQLTTQNKKMNKKIKEQASEILQMKSTLDELMSKIDLLVASTDKTKQRNRHSSAFGLPGVRTCLSSTRASGVNPIGTESFSNPSILMNTTIKNNQKLMMNSDRIPKYGTSQKQTVTAFLCHDVAEFADMSCVEGAFCVSKWIHLCFEDAYKLRVKAYTKEILEDKPNISLTDFLLALAQKLTRRAVRDLDEDTKKRHIHDGEGFEDYVLRLRREFMAIQVPYAEINQRIIEASCRYEENQRMKSEIQRFFDFGSTLKAIPDREIDEIARKIDKIVGTGEVDNNMHGHVDAVRRNNARQTTEMKPSAPEPPRFMDRECAVCGDSIVEYNRSYLPYTTCRNCFLDEFCVDNGLPLPRYDYKNGIPMFFDEDHSLWRRYPKETLHAMPHEFLRSGTRLRKIHAPNSRLVHPTMSQRNAYKPARFNNRRDQSFMPGRRSQNSSNWNQRAYRSTSNPASTTYSQAANDGFRPAPKSLQNWNKRSKSPPPHLSNNVNKTTIAALMADQKRLKANSRDRKVRISADGVLANKDVKCLIDNGANCDVIPLKLVKKLGISDLIKPDFASCSSFNGASIESPGRIQLEVILGDIIYTGNFTVVPSLTSYDLILGSPFLMATGIHHKVMKALEDVCGNGIIRQDF